MAKIVVGMGFGDEGKGTTVDYLARMVQNDGRSATVIRFNGGGQAGHNVVTPEQIHHCFSHFGSGSFAGARTHLSQFMLVDPGALFNEANALIAKQVPAFDNLSIDGRALIVTPFQVAANRLRETTRSNRRHGSCGMGIGETMKDQLAGNSLTVRGVFEPGALETLKLIQELKRIEFSDHELYELPVAREEFHLLMDPDAPAMVLDSMRYILGSICITDGPEIGVDDELIFEGAQGVMLDMDHGYFPHVTFSKTTFENALAILDEIGYEGSVEKIGVTRAYHTRHGRGPFVSEDAELTARLPDPNNVRSEWQEGFRSGWFDEVVAKYATKVCGGIDTLVVTNVDRLIGLGYRQLKVCVEHDAQNPEIADPVFDSISRPEILLDRIVESFAPTNRVIVSSGPTWKDKHESAYSTYR